VLGILGSANSATALDGSTNYMFSTDAFYNPGDTDFTMGGWFYYANWASGAATQVLMNIGDPANIGFQLLTVASSTVLRFYTPTGAATQSSIDVTHGFSNNTWHHIAVKYRGTPDTWDYYLDGVKVASVVQVKQNSIK